MDVVIKITTIDTFQHRSKPQASGNRHGEGHRAADLEQLSFRRQV